MPLLPALAALLFVHHAQLCSGSRRLGVLVGAVAFGVTLTALTELLSAADSLTAGGVALCWALACALLGLGAVWRARRARAAAPRADAPRPRAFTTAHVALLGGVALIAFAALVVALAAAPNTFDSMTYHMSRVMHWLSNGTVKPYPTHILRQLHQAPWAEYAIAHVQVLSGTDRFANLVQWFSYAGSMVGVSVIAGQLGARRRGQLLAVVVAATIPMAILQASSTKNDLVVTFWLVCFVALWLRLRAEPAASAALPWWLALGGSLGLATLSKATAYLIAAPFVVWIVVAAVRARGARAALPLAGAALVLLAVNAGFFSRNAAVYGAWLGPGREAGEHAYANELITARVVVSNVVRNAALHVGTPLATVNSAANAGIRRLHRLIGVDVEDPRTTWLGMRFYVPPLSTHEDDAGSPLHAALLVAAALLLLGRRDAAWRLQTTLVTCLGAAFVLLALYLKWQPWHARLHMPLFVLAAPLAGVALERLRRPAASLVGAALLLASLPWVLHNAGRPLVGGASVLRTPRSDQYFANWPSLRGPYQHAVSFLHAQRCADVGLIAGWDDYEYPFWALLSEHVDGPVRVRHVLVRNESARWRTASRGGAEAPCALIEVRHGSGPAADLEPVGYRAVWAQRPVIIHLRTAERPR